MLETVALTEETDEAALERLAATLDNERRTEEASKVATEEAEGRVIDDVMPERYDALSVAAGVPVDWDVSAEPVEEAAAAEEEADAADEDAACG